MRRTREPSAVSDVLSVMRLSRRAPPPPADERAPDDARADATSCADALLEVSALVNERVRAESATAVRNFFFMAGLWLRGLVRPSFR